MKTLLFASCIVALAASTSAFAQAKPEPQNDRASARTFWRFARCAADSAPDRVQKLLEPFPWTSKDEEAASKFAKARSDCLMPGDSLAFRSDLFQGALASAFLVKKYAGKPFPNFAQFPFAFGPDGLTGMEANSRRYYVSLAFSECVFRTSPTATWAVFKAEPYSPADTEAFTALGPIMSVCLPLSPGDQVQFTRSALRNFLAIASHESDKRVTAIPVTGAK